MCVCMLFICGVLTCSYLSRNKFVHSYIHSKTGASGQVHTIHHLHDVNVCMLILYVIVSFGRRNSKFLNILMLPAALCTHAHSSSASPESGLGTSHTSLPGSGPGSASEQHNEDMFEAEPLQPLFMCKALYPFDGMFDVGVCSFADTNETTFCPFRYANSQERGKHSNERERGVARDRAGPGRRMDACATPPQRRRMGGGLRADLVHRNPRAYHVRVEAAAVRAPLFWSLAESVVVLVCPRFPIRYTDPNPETET